MFSLLRRNRNIRLVVLAQIISYLGDWFTFVALAGLVQDLTDSKFLVSVVMVSFTFPSFLMSPIAGPVSDRFDRRKILVVVSFAQAAAALGLLTVDTGRVWTAFLFQGLIAALASFVGPSTSASIPNLVDSEEDLRIANAITGSTWGVMLALGAAIGGVFAAAFGRDAAFIADAVSFVLAGLLFLMINRATQTHDTSAGARPPVRPVEDMEEAIHVARQDPVILALMSSKMTYAIGAGIVSQLAVLASTAFHSGDSGRGMLIAARGLGAGIGPVVASKFIGKDLSRLLLTCGFASLGFSVCYFGAAVSPGIAVAFVFVAVAHFGGGAQWVMSSVGLQMRAPDHVRGRVLSGDFALVSLVIASTSIVAGLTSQNIGVRPAMMIFAGVAAVASSGYLAATKRLRLRLRSEQQR